MNYYQIRILIIEFKHCNFVNYTFNLFQSYKLKRLFNFIYILSLYILPFLNLNFITRFVNLMYQNYINLNKNKKKEN